MHFHRVFAVAALALAVASAAAQWEIQDAHTTASLRGIHYVGNGVAWASGTDGTVLRTEDMGFVWQLCTIPPGAEKLDFRGIQAFDNNTAIVMSSGKGDLSRLYKTTDGCQTWKLVFTDTDPNGFWDAVQAHPMDTNPSPGCPQARRELSGSIFGDPSVHKFNEQDTTRRPSFYLATFTISLTCGSDNLSRSAGELFSGPGQQVFAASNSNLVQPAPNNFWLATSTQLIQYTTSEPLPNGFTSNVSICPMSFALGHGSDSAGAFAIAVRLDTWKHSNPLQIINFFRGSTACVQKVHMVVVGGDYKSPNDREQTAAFNLGENSFHPAITPPGGYRSAVAYDARSRSWITVGPNGTDISTDDGRNWHPLKPGRGDAPDADQHWNALSLPFVVGPKGRIGLLRNERLLKPKSSP